MADKSLEEYKAEAHEKGKQAAKDLSDALNSMTFEKEVIKGFAEGMTSQHRTLQQCSMRAIYAVIEQFSQMYDDGNFDLRNQDTVEFCRRIVGDNKHTHFSFI